MKKLCFLLLILMAPLAAQAQAAPVHGTNVLSWLPASFPGATYNVYKAAGSCSGTFAKLTATPITALTYSDSGNADGAANCYYVKAVNNGVESTPSNTELCTTPTITAAPAVTPPPGALTSISQ